MKTLVAYYSLTGNVKEIAEKLAKAFDADILRIEPVKEIPSSKFGRFMIGGMKATFGCCVPMKPYDMDLEVYDRIVLGTPVWAGKPASVVNTFVKECGCKEKIYGVFTSSMSGDGRKCVNILDKKLDNMKFAVCLADRNGKLVELNDEVMQDFIDHMN